jgi:D-beta-D-heptose 7-phosphate kinase/D-beta-D-heptose 1-phosphate adenosyltransferase
MKTIVLVTGGYDPLHSGHISYFKSAKELGDILIVGINSDSWLERKKGRAFMPSTERVSIIENLKMVDYCLLFDDSDGSAKEAIRNVRKLFPNDRIIFANGGDRTATNIPEFDIVDDNLIFKFGVGGEYKMNSSSWILEEWKAPKTERPWGYYRVLHEVPGMKVKELTVNPGQKLSMQRHTLRSEYWIVSDGQARVASELSGGYTVSTINLEKHDSYDVDIGHWHQLLNPFDVPVKIVEIQYGDQCTEEDIERK